MGNQGTTGAPIQIFVEGLRKAFTRQTTGGRAEPLFDGLTLSLAQGGLYTFFGPNGSGKSTLLNLIAGLIKPDGGVISICGHEPEPSAVAYVFQTFRDALFTWRTVEGNLMFPLQCGGSGKHEQQMRLRDFLAEFHFPVPLQARTYELSTGQQQMLCLARALITRPSLLLLDEPFAALDFRMRRLMQEQLLRYWRQSHATVLLVSHDIDEAIYMGQTLLLLPPCPVKRIRDIPIPFPANRERSIMFTQEFLQLRSDALSYYEHELDHTS